jgi:hypothetical protein
MSYQVFCECGKAAVVEAPQAGTTLICSCGRSIEVPSLSALEQLSPSPTDTPSLLAPGSVNALRKNMEAVREKSRREQKIRRRRRLESATIAAFYVVFAVIAFVVWAALMRSCVPRTDPISETSPEELVREAHERIQGRWRNVEPEHMGRIVEFEFKPKEVILTRNEGNPISRGYTISPGHDIDMNNMQWREREVGTDIKGAPIIQHRRMLLNQAPVIDIEEIGAFIVIFEADKLHLKTFGLKSEGPYRFGYELERAENQDTKQPTSRR